MVWRKPTPYTDGQTEGLLVDLFSLLMRPVKAVITVAYTSHASIRYRKQLPPQPPVGTIGTVWQESTPSKETMGPAQTRPYCETLWKLTACAIKQRTRNLYFSLRALANWFSSLTSNSDCCYHQLSVATLLGSFSYQRPLAEKAAGWISKFSDREEFFSRT